MSWLSSVLALTHRDLLHELRGRRGVALMFTATLLLAPTASVPRPQFTPPPRVIVATGDIPESIRSIPDVREVQNRPAMIAFHESPAGPLQVTSLVMPADVRAELDGGEPIIEVAYKPFTFPIIHRGLLLSLLGAAFLTGSVSESMGGERARRTLEGLLAAAIRPHQIVVGKWLAWAGLGGGMATLAAILTVALGRLPAGVWMLAVPLVAAQAVALGLFLMRNAKDAITGATVSMRWMPLALGGTAVFSWGLSFEHPWLAAAMPLGGAAIASGGSISHDFVPAACAFAVSWTGLLLYGTSKQLGQDPAPLDPRISIAREVSIAALLAALCMQPILIGPLVWNYAHRAELMPPNSISWGLLAAALALGAVTLLRRLRHDQPLPREAPPYSPAVAIGAIALGAATLLPLPHANLGELVHSRAQLVLHPLATGHLLGLTLIASQEVFFRGWLQRRVGPVAATFAWVAAAGLYDPLGALLSGAALSLAASRGGSPVLAALVLRLMMEAAR